MIDTLDPIENLIVVRLLASGKTGVSENMISKDISPLVQHRFEGALWTQNLKDSLQSLEKKDLINRHKKGRSIKVDLTPDGKIAAMGYLCVTSIPSDITWSKLLSNYLVPCALGLKDLTPESRKKIASAGGLKGALLKKSLELPISEIPTETQAIDALLWSQLGIKTSKSFSLTEVKKHLLNCFLGTEKPLDFKKCKNLLPAKTIGSRRGDLGDLRLTLLRRLIDKSSTFSGEKIDLHQFASDVIQAAKQCSSGHFGSEKVFISHIWKEFSNKFSNYRINIDTFKEYLALANHRGLISLSRADLVEAMEPTDVADSETTYLNARYHFVRILGDAK